MTIHRALGFVDRSVLSDDSPLRVVMASEGRQADGIDLRMSGADLSRYRANPVLGYGHSYYGRTNLPIGRVDPGSIAVSGAQLVGELEFDQGDEFAREIERKMRAGYINAVSIGFDVRQWESSDQSYWKGGVATKWELSELSVVPVPMDAAALVTAGRSLDATDPALIRELVALSDADYDKVRARFLELAGASADRLMFPATDRQVAPVAAPDPEPPTGVPTDSARGLLDAFTTKKESHV
jgi:HK97 family phage prohead protease